MDRNLENIILETSMEKFLRSKLREQEELNEELALLVRDKVQITPDDVVRFKTIERVINNMAKEPMSDRQRHDTLMTLVDLVRK